MMNFKRTGCFAIVSIVLALLMWFSYEEIEGSTFSAPIFEKFSDLEHAENESVLRETVSNEFWHILNPEDGCVYIPKLSKSRLPAHAIDSNLRLGKISFTISVYVRSKPDSDLPTTADSVLVPEEDFSFTSDDHRLYSGAAQYDGQLINDQMCDIRLISDDGAFFTLDQVLSSITHPSRRVAILQLYAHYSDSDGFVVHTTSLFLRSDEALLRAYKQI